MAPHWVLVTLPSEDGKALTGRHDDSARRFRLGVMVSTVGRARAELARAEAELSAELAAARRDGQGLLADEAERILAERG